MSARNHSSMNRLTLKYPLLAIITICTLCPSGSAEIVTGEGTLLSGAAVASPILATGAVTLSAISSETATNYLAAPAPKFSGLVLTKPAVAQSYSAAKATYASIAPSK